MAKNVAGSYIAPEKCPRCGEEVEECEGYIVSWGHRHSGQCDGYLHKRTGLHEC